MVEESQELTDADPEHQLEEVADIYEVLLTVMALLDVTIEDVQKVADAKRAAHGGFDERILLEDY